MYVKNYLKEIFLCVIIVLIIGLYGLNYYEYFYMSNQRNNQISTENNDKIFEVKKEESNEKTKSKIFVEVKGAVASPGVYLVEETNIIDDVINMAGGFVYGAYTKNINLSKKVQDEMVIYVYTNYEYNLKQITETKKEECKCPSYDISKCISGKSSIILTDESASEVDETEDENTLVNINTATIQQLTTLSGIGEAKAKKIIEYREKNGLFEKTEDIVNVSGISQTTYENIKENITV